MADKIDGEEAAEKLAQDLHYFLEKYDPNDSPEWSGLTDHQKNIYRATIRQLLCYDRDVFLAALDWARGVLTVPKNPA